MLGSIQALAAPAQLWQKNLMMAKNRRTSIPDQQIDANLRRVYSEKLNEPLPERLTQLLEQLRQHRDEKPEASSEDDE